ncbi:EboA domain-containing protein [Massilia sp. MB5]|nr:EboA domain-containing protein [Massilia sp. MB5]UMR29640.1 EboA domain-containing protein [Massilia sp. MB5]
MNTVTDSGQRSGAAIVMLDGWLRARLPGEALAWFGGQLEALMGQDGAAVLARALGQAPRRLGRDALRLDAVELAQAGRLRPGLEPGDWRIDQAARIAFVLAAYGGQEVLFAQRLDALADTAEINEAIALYRGFPLYPAAEAIEHRAREAVRSSMRPVYEAIAHRNPYPVERFDEGAWNQMVVKSFFSTAHCGRCKDWSSAPIRRWRRCCSTWRMSAGRQDGQSVPSCGAASRRMPMAGAMPPCCAYWKAAMK